MEGWESCKHLVHKNTEGPPIDGLTVTLVEKDLRCDVLGGTANCEGALSYYLSEAEIDHLEISIIGDHDVLGFEISVHDVFTM